MLQQLKQLQGTTIPLLAPSSISAKGFPGAIRITWSEVPGAAFYQVFESATNAKVGSLVQVVPANRGGSTNAFTRSGIGDTNTRFYYVAPVSPTGTVGASSTLASASAIINIPSGFLTAGSPIDLLSNGVFAKPLASTLNAQGQIDLSSNDVLNRGGLLSVSSFNITPSLTDSGIASFADVAVAGNPLFVIDIDAGQSAKPIVLLSWVNLSINVANGKVDFGVFNTTTGLIVPQTHILMCNQAGVNQTFSMNAVDTAPAAGQNEYHLQWQQEGTNVATLLSAMLGGFSLPG